MRSRLRSQSQSRSRLLFHRSGGCVKAVSLRSSSLQSSSLQSLSALERRRTVAIAASLNLEIPSSVNAFGPLLARWPSHARVRLLNVRKRVEN